MATEESLGKGFESALNTKIVYDKVDSEISKNEVSGTLTLKLDFPSVEEFNNFVGDKWQGSGREQVWIGNQIFDRDNKLLTNKSIMLQYLRYKDSIFDAAPVVLILAKYSQDIKDRKDQNG